MLLQDNLDNFVKRLHSCLQKQELDRLIANHFENKMTTLELERLLHAAIAAITENKECLLAKQPIRIKKTVDMQQIPRTMHIYCDPIDHTYHLIIETKSKLAGGDKILASRRQDFIFQGTYKYGKSALALRSTGKIEDVVSLRIADKDLNSFNVSLNKLLTKLHDPKESKSVIVCGREHVVNYAFGCAYSVTSGKHVMQSKIQVSLFSLRAKCSLYLLDTKKFSLKDKKVILYQILLGLRWMHYNKFVHMDIKSNNILLYQDAQFNTIAKIADFDLVTIIGSIICPMAAKQYCAPEIMNYHFNVFAKHLVQQGYYPKDKIQLAIIDMITNESLDQLITSNMLKDRALCRIAQDFEKFYIAPIQDIAKQLKYADISKVKSLNRLKKMMGNMPHNTNNDVVVKNFIADERHDSWPVGIIMEDLFTNQEFSDPAVSEVYDGLTQYDIKLRLSCTEAVDILAKDLSLHKEYMYSIDW